MKRQTKIDISNLPVVIEYTYHPDVPAGTYAPRDPAKVEITRMYIVSIHEKRDVTFLLAYMDRAEIEQEILDEENNRGKAA